MKVCACYPEWAINFTFNSGDSTRFASVLVRSGGEQRQLAPPARNISIKTHSARGKTSLVLEM